MARILFTTVSALGHLHPLVPLARAADAAGDEVLIATGPDLADWVTSCGLAHAPAGRGGQTTWSAEERTHFERLGPMRPYHLFTTVLVPQMAGDLLDLCRAWEPDLIVHEETELAAPLVAALLGLPCVTHSYAAPARPEEERGIMLDLLGPVWAEHGPAEPRVTGEVYLDACPPAFQTDAVRSIPSVRPIRPVGFDGPPDAPPPWLAAVERPAAYVTFGTVAVFSRPEVIQEAAAATAPVVRGCVVTTGPNPPDELALPDGVVVQQYVQQSLVLGAVDVVVSHGGAGTTLGAIEHGLPHVVLPQQPFSQLRNAQRIEALGLGAHVPQGSYEELGPAVRRVLEDPRCAARVAAMRDSFDELPAPAEVLADLRRLA